MKLILTEKPDVSRQVKDALAPDAKFMTFATTKQGKVGYYENKEFLICNTVGHIVEILPPNEINESFNWDLNALPYDLPKDLPTKISKDKKDIFKAIQYCFDKHSYDEIIIATDGDREGQNIWRKIRKHLKKYKPKKEMRMWLSEWTSEGIKKSYKNRFENAKKENLGLAAQCREEADYKWGMQGTVAVTKKYQNYGKSVASIGRVMTPTLGFVVQRENDILNFIPEPYKNLIIESKTDEKENILLKHIPKETWTLQDSNNLEKKLNKIKKVKIEKEVKKTSKKSPQLYDGTSIMQDMNKRYGFSAKKTTDIIQKLYQTYTLTTYPGTNDTKISQGTADNAYDAFKNLKGLYPDIVNEITKNKWKVSKHVVTTEDLPHEAITPVFGTANLSNISKLTNDELKVYQAICERFLAVFYPDAQFEDTKVSTTVENEVFRNSGKVVLEKGWMKVLGVSSDTILPKITNGKEYNVVNIISEEKMTTPPSRFTEDGLIDAMKHAGRYVNDKEAKSILNNVEGLGTTRTRASIIENLKNKEYISLNKKTIFPTEKAMKLFEALPEVAIKSPIMTSEFESLFHSVEEGKLSKDNCMNKLDKELHTFIKKVKEDKGEVQINSSSFNSTTSSTSKSNLGLTCPRCGKEMRENSLSYYCVDYNGCKFSVWKEIAKKKISLTVVKELVNKGETKTLKGMRRKTGETFDAKLYIKEDGKIGFKN